MLSFHAPSFLTIILSGSTLEALFWIAVSNFFIPVMLSITQLIMIWTSKNIMVVAPICMVNIYVEIIGVLLATIWANGSQWRDDNSSGNAPVLTTVRVEMDESMKGYTSVSVGAKPWTS